MTGHDLQAAFIPSGGKTMLGGLYRAGGELRAPAALLLHGLPGHEKNLDLAVDLRQRGIHVLYFHYRGSWGSPGDFAFENLVPDAAAALTWLAHRPEVDPSRLALVGFSLGGWVALSLAARSSKVAACVAISPLIDPGHVPLPDDLADESAATLHGATPSRLKRGWASLPSALETASAMGIPTLLVSGDGDELFPPIHYSGLARSLAHLRWVRFPRADHAFSDVRPGLRHVVARWLRETLPPREEDLPGSSVPPGRFGVAAGC